MPDYRIIALDLDGTLLNSEKELSPRNLSALEKAAAAGIEIVPTTGRFYGGMPEIIRSLPFVRYAITINGAEVKDLKTGEIIYSAEIPMERSLEIMELLDTLPVIYDCYMGSAGFMSASHKALTDSIVDNPHYRKMIHELRKDVPELKDFVRSQGRGTQKIQFFTRDMAVRKDMLDNLSSRIPALSVSSAEAQNVEINDLHANKGEALLALAAHLGLPASATMSFGDGLNDLSMLSAAGLGVAMENACEEAKAAADIVTASCDDDGVALAIEKYCFN